MNMRAIITTIALLLAACAAPRPVAPVGLREAPGWAKERCPEAPNIPADEASNTKARASYYGSSRDLYAKCRAKQAALAAHVETIEKK